jgi:hypothetical protein
LLLTTEDQVCLDARRVWSDSAAFEDLCTEGAVQPPLTALRQAVDLYRGPLLANFSLPGCAEFEDWLLVEQRKFERHYLTTLETLVNGWEAAGDYHQAIQYACRYLEVDSLAEAMHRRLIVFYAQVGDRTTALRQFETCTAALERDLGVGPLPETRVAYQSVLDGKLPSPQPEILTPKRPFLPSLETPLVGREGALTSLRQLLAKAQAGRGQIVFLSGEAGIGKSRLVRDFAAQLEGQAVVLVASAYPAISKPPYQPLVEALRTALDVTDVPVQFLSHCSPVWLAEVTRLLPEIRDLRRDLPAPLPGEPDEVRTRLFEALSQFIRSLTVTGLPVLLALDNLQWADSATLEWLAYFGQRIHDRRVMFLGTSRRALFHRLHLPAWTPILSFRFCIISFHQHLEMSPSPDDYIGQPGGILFFCWKRCVPSARQADCRATCVAWMTFPSRRVYAKHWTPACMSLLRALAKCWRLPR